MGAQFNGLIEICKRPTLVATRAVNYYHPPTQCAQYTTFCQVVCLLLTSDAASGAEKMHRSLKL